jgi:signal transduction histidine kinase
VLLAAGLGINAYLITGAVQQRDTATLLSRGYSLAVPFMPAMTQERRASLAAVSNPTPENKAALEQARGGFNQLMGQFSGISTQVADAMPPGAKASIQRFVGTMTQVPAIRQQIDSGQASRLAVYDTFNQIGDAMITAADAIGRDSTDKDVALQRSLASDLMRVSDWLDRSDSLAAAAYQRDGMTSQEVDQFTSLTRAYRADLVALEPRLPAEQQRKLDDLRSSPEWAQLTKVEDALVRQGFDPRPQRPGEVESLPITLRQWQDATRTIAAGVSSLGLGDLGSIAASAEKRSADDALTRSVSIAVGSLLIAILVLLLAVRMGNDLVRRLRQLRADTLEADRRLPLAVARIRKGERVDVATEVPGLDYGTDEIGEVAEAFTKAQQTAVAAAVQEAQLREGTNAVFLNIARRSQAVVHRQLQVLDKAERGADDPDQVALLYQLDHLSTRERRNAENLIILGGGQLTRQWRNSVRLIDVVRSAVSETEQYKRVTLGQLPDLQVAGHVVADLMHLLAELVDNAIAFSPPESRIEVRGNPVGKGAVVEIDDQGLGMSEEERERVNAMLREPPNFNVMALTEDSRIGFFVVARLASQHDIRISLMESSYGGIRAIVLIPTSSLAAGQEPEPHAQIRGSDTELSMPALIPARRQPDGPAPMINGLPQRTRHRAHLTAGSDSALQWPEAAPSEDRPPLPKRRRQKSLAPQLMDTPEPADDEPATNDDHETNAVEARNLMAAFQRGTQRGRADNQP